MTTDVASLRGYIPYTVADRAGFVLPVFKAPALPHLAVQVPDIRSERVLGFASLEAGPETTVTKIEHSRQVRPGEALVYGFCDTNMIAHFGSLEELKDVLENFLNGSSELSINLQIVELIGSSGARLKARQNMVDHVEDVAGKQASENFSNNSIFLQVLWEGMVSQVLDEEKLELLASKRKWLLLEASPNVSGIFPRDAQTWLETEIGIDSIALAGRIEAELPFSLGRDAPHRDIKPSLFDDPVSDAIEEIRGESRQEGRVAALIKKIIEQPEVAVDVARSYRDYTKFADEAGGVIRENVNNFRLPLNPGFVEWLVVRLYSMAYTKQKGLVLYELARQLGGYEEFANAILRKAHESQFETVRFALNAINEQIENPGSPERLPFRPPAYAYRDVVRR